MYVIIDDYIIIILCMKTFFIENLQVKYLRIQGSCA